MADAPQIEEPHHLERATRALAAQEVRLVSTLVLLLGLGLLLALPFVLSIGSVVFLPFVAGLFLSILLAPLAAKLVRIGVPNLIASLLALLIFIAAFGTLLGLILQPALDTFDRLPQMVAKITAEMSELRGSFKWLEDFNRQLGRLAGSGTRREVVIAGPTVIEQLAFATPSVVIEILLTLLVTFFMIAARARLISGLLHDRVTRGTGVKAAQIMRAVQQRVGTYIATVTMINAGVGVLVAFGAWAFGLEAPWMWGGLAAVLNFLPYVGPMIMIAALTLFGLGTQANALVGIIPALAFLGLHAVESNVVTPAILGRRFTMNPVLILFSISYFSWIWGVSGALLSIPILITLKALFDHIGTPNLLGFLFGEPLFEPPEDEGSG